MIGTVFGGEFGDQLQVGMRLPEICEQMSAAMQRRGLTDQLTQQVTTEFRQVVLKHRPALLDETGSFTASTLASRVAKAFDLMGGACALDSDDTSGLSAIAVAADQLRSGTCDMIVCGSAQRSMSLSAFEALDMNGQLVRSGRPEDVPDDCSRILPGEGVVALMLCRLSDARRLDLPIHGILGDVVQLCESAGRPSMAFEENATGCDGDAVQVLNAADAKIVRQVGYLAGAHSLVRITAETLAAQQEHRTSRPVTSIRIAARTADGIVLHAPLSIPTAAPGIETQVLPTPPIQQQRSFPKSMQLSPQMSTATTAIEGPLRSVRFAATSSASLLQLLKNASTRVNQIGIDNRVIRDS